MIPRSVTFWPSDIVASWDWFAFENVQNTAELTVYLTPSLSKMYGMSSKPFVIVSTVPETSTSLF
jgi:hypothetical protein